MLEDRKTWTVEILKKAYIDRVKNAFFNHRCSVITYPEKNDMVIIVSGYEVDLDDAITQCKVSGWPMRRIA